MKLLFPGSLLLLVPSLSAQSTLRVPADHATIQAALQAAANGDTVLVAPGTYHEQLDLLGKQLVLRSEAGPDQTVIDSQGRADWFDGPAWPVIRMLGGEGPGTVIEGFTVTGGADNGSNQSAGIWALRVNPTVRDCKLVGIRGGPGFWGGGLLEDCVLSDNWNLPYGDGGGASNWHALAPLTLRDCVIKDNRSGGRGGGVYLEQPADVVRCTITGNEAGNGFDGYTGGGLWGPARMFRTLVADNLANYHMSGGPAPDTGSGVDGALELIQCTVANNRLGNAQFFQVQSAGGVRNVGLVRSSILWANFQTEVSPESAPAVDWSLVMGGFSGTGNLAGDPLFVDEAAGDYRLRPGSPAIDAGDPAGIPDPDGSRPDMGALGRLQVQATRVTRNGNGVNPLCYSSSLAVLGQDWVAAVDATAHGFAGTLTGLSVYAGALPPAPLPFGELLIDPTSTRVAQFAQPPGATGSAIYVIPVPNSAALNGAQLFTQAFTLGAPGQIGLCNAVDLVLGN